MRKSLRLGLLTTATVLGLLFVVHGADQSTTVMNTAPPEIIDPAIQSPISEQVHSSLHKTAATTPFVLSRRDPNPQDVIQFVAAQHPNTFLNSLVLDPWAMGKYNIFKEQRVDVDHDGQEEIVLMGEYRKYLTYLAMVGYRVDSSTPLADASWLEMLYFETRVYSCNDVQVSVRGEHVFLKLLDCDVTDSKASVSSLPTRLECGQQICIVSVGEPFAPKH